MEVCLVNPGRLWTVLAGAGLMALTTTPGYGQVLSQEKIRKELATLCQSDQVQCIQPSGPASGWQLPSLVPPPPADKKQAPREPDAAAGRPELAPRTNVMASAANPLFNKAKLTLVSCCQSDQTACPASGRQRQSPDLAQTPTQTATNAQWGRAEATGQEGPATSNTPASASGVFAASGPANPPMWSDAGDPLDDSWSGFYVGLNTGGGIGEDSTTQSATFTSTLLHTNGLLSSSSRDAPVGWNYGGQLGYNQQISCLVIGLEADWQGTSQKDTIITSTPPATLQFFGAGANGFGFSMREEHKLTDFGTLRGRAGVVVNDSLLYVTGGLAWGTAKDRLAFSGSANPIIFPRVLQPGPFLPSEESFSHSRTGWAAGAGVETRLSAHWSVKLEYLFIDLGSVNQTIGIPINPRFGPAFTRGGVATATSRWFVTDNIIRVGLNYKF